jgi:oligosaccharyltransferase complex subunit epsilon
MAKAKKLSTDSQPTKASPVEKHSGPILGRLWTSYLKTDSTLLIIDALLVFIMFTGIIQFIYMCIVGTYPYNAFLSGFGCSVGMFVNTANMRIQLNKDNDFKISNERAYADYMFSSLVLFVFCICFVG